MKYLKVVIEPFRIKGDPDDEDQLRQDIYEKLMAQMEAEVLNYYIDYDDEEEDD